MGYNVKLDQVIEEDRDEFQILAKLRKLTHRARYGYNISAEDIYALGDKWRLPKLYDNRYTEKVMLCYGNSRLFSVESGCIDDIKKFVSDRMTTLAKDSLETKDCCIYAITLAERMQYFDKNLSRYTKAPKGWMLIAGHLWFSQDRIVLTTAGLDYAYQFRDLIQVEQDEFITTWAKMVMRGIHAQHELKRQEKIKLMEQLMNINTSLGSLGMLLRVGEEGSVKVILEGVEQLKEYALVDSVVFNKSIMTIKTKDVFSEETRTNAKRYMGVLEIEFQPLHGMIRFRNIASPSKTSQHPHASTDNICDGTFGNLFQSCLADFDYYTLFLTVIEFLRTSNRNDFGAAGNFQKLPVEKPDEAKLHCFDKWIMLFSGTKDESTRARSYRNNFDSRHGERDGNEEESDAELRRYMTEDEVKKTKKSRKVAFDDDEDDEADDEEVQLDEEDEEAEADEDEDDEG